MIAPFFLANPSQGHVWERLEREARLFGLNRRPDWLGFNPRAGRTDRARHVLAGRTLVAPAGSKQERARKRERSRQENHAKWFDDARKIQFAVTIGSRVLEARFPSRKEALAYAEQCDARLPAGSPEPRVISERV
jgi:hypothetical protein